MTDIRNSKPGPIEVWLSQPNIEITCRIVREDETAAYPDVDSLSLRGAQREITAWLIGLGYAPVGRWETEGRYDEVAGGVEETPECVRRFKPDKVETPI
jgi:hypothetical protein